MTQMTIDDLFEENEVEPVHREIIFSPGELASQGIKWTNNDAERWEKQVWQVYHRERREHGKFITWFQAIEIYKSERYNFPKNGGKK